MVLDPDFKSIHQLIQNVYHITEFQFYDSCIYVFVDSDENICLMDSGNGRSFNAVELALESINLNISNITTVILTHEHFDHIFGIYELLDRCKNKKLQIFAHPVPCNILKKGVGDLFNLSPLGLTLRQFRINLRPIKILPLQENDIVLFGNMNFTILECPGHSPGSICIYEKFKKILVSGDVIFSEGGYGRVDHPYGASLPDLKNSISRLNKLNILHLFPGHGLPVVDIAIKHIHQSWENIHKLSKI